MENDYENQLDEIYSVIDELMHVGNFKAIDLMLKYVSSDTEIDILLGFLTITLPIKTKLWNRVALIDYVMEKENNIELIRGLE